MQRFPNPDRESLTPEGQKIWDVIDQTRGGVWGPYAVLMGVPQLAERVAAVGEYLRFHGSLADIDRELAILVSAEKSNCPFEWAIHEPIALKAGLTKDMLDSIRGSIEPLGFSARQNLIVEVIRELFDTKTLKEESFLRAKAEFGQEQLLEITVIAGFYRMLAFVLNAFDVEIPSPQEVKKT